ncbi:MAG: ATPase, partial [Candidatus Angelobacter sp.]
GAFISDLVEAATGINLWREWARIEVCDVLGEPYVLPKFTQKYAGSVLCLAKTEEPDTSAFDAPEIVTRMKKHHHAGLIVCSESASRVRELLEQYSSEFAQRFLAALPPPDKPTA